MSAGSEILLQAREQGLKIFEVPIIVRYDQGESSQNPISHGLDVLLGIFGRVVYKKPLVYFTCIGTILLVFGGGIGFWSLGAYVESGRLPFGPSVAMLLFLIVGSISIFSGMVLHNMERIIKEIKK